MRKFKKICEECWHCDNELGKKHSNVWLCLHPERNYNFCSTERIYNCDKKGKNWEPLNETVRNKYLDSLPFYKKINLKEVIKGWLLT